MLSKKLSKTSKLIAIASYLVKTLSFLVEFYISQYPGMTINSFPEIKSNPCFKNQPIK